MHVPTVGSTIKVLVKYDQGSVMIPPRDTIHVHEGKVLQPYRWLTDREFCMSGDDSWPIRVINMDLVDSLEVITGSTKKIETQVKTYEIQGSKGNKYLVTRTNKGWTCTCPGHQFRKQCKHVSELSAK